MVKKVFQIRFQNPMSSGKIILYTANGRARLDVKLENNTVWLSQAQMAELFQKDLRTINEHIKNIFKEAELSQNQTIRKFRIVQKEGSKDVERDITFYNLDVIISVGYRVKSQRGTQFRIWATNVLRDHLVKGFTINQKRLQSQDLKMKELQDAVNLLQSAMQKQLSLDELSGLLSIITDYTNTWILLQKYDENNIDLKESNITNLLYSK